MNRTSGQRKSRVSRCGRCSRQKHEQRPRVGRVCSRSGGSFIVYWRCCRFLRDFEAGGDEGGMMLNPVVLNMVSDQVGASLRVMKFNSD